MKRITQQPLNQLLPDILVIIIAKAIAITFLFFSHGFYLNANADDIDIFFQNQSSSANVLFILDTSGSMDDHFIRWKDSSGKVTKIRRHVAMKKAFKVMMQGAKDVNAGIMRFDPKNRRWGQMLLPVENINNKSGQTTYRDRLISKVNSFVVKGETPLTMALLEAGLYFEGKAPSANVLCTTQNQNDGVCKESKKNTFSYIPPPQQDCTKNFIILLTDGKARYNGTNYVKRAQNLIKRYTGLKQCKYMTKGNSSQNCGADLTQHFKDKSPAAITTYTVGFDLKKDTGSINFLKAIAQRGGGKSFTPNDANALLNDFQTILEEINTQTNAPSNSFTAPATTINPLQMLQNTNEVYLPVLLPDEKFGWKGNIKKYRFSHANVSSGQLVDRKGKPVYSRKKVKGSTFFTFDESTTDLWDDGSKTASEFVSQGGAESRINKETNANTPKRTIYWENADGNLILLDKTKLGLTKFTKLLKSKKIDATLQKMGISTSDAVDWLIGKSYSIEKNSGLWKANGKDRHVIGDIIHSQLSTVEFNGKKLLIVGSNAGQLHLFSTNGEELFSIIPNAMLNKLDQQIKNDISNEHHYGVDGPITLHQSRQDKELMIYFGLRRGGRAYYALQLDQNLSPSLKWKITPSSPGFANLGQSWSKPRVTTLFEKDVIIFGGGYDPASGDNLSKKRTTKNPDLGSDIYIVNRSDGTLVWSTATTQQASIPSNVATPSNTNWKLTFQNQMLYSIVGDIQLVDTNSDGEPNQFYAADTGGQLWRFDVQGRDHTIIGGVIANMSSHSANNSYHRFYHSPDLSISTSGGERTLIIAIGSGWRANPFSNQHDNYFFAIKQPLATLSNYPEQPIAFTDLALVPAANHEEYKKRINMVEKNKNGWRYHLSGAGEKTFSTSLTLNGKLFFSTLLPASTVEQCGQSTPASSSLFKVYAINLFNASPFVDFDGSGDEKGDCDGDRCKIVNLAATPAPFFNEKSVQALLLPEDPIDVDSLRSTQTYWKNNY